MKFRYLASALCSLPVGVWAADANGDFAIKGAGLQTCGALAQAFDLSSRDLALYGGWLEGYVTGVNQFTENSFDFTPWQNTQTMLGLLKLACDQSSAETQIMVAFNQVLRALAPGRLTEKSPVEQVSDGTRATVIYSDLITRIQQRLIALEHGEVTVNGEMDEPTTQALSALQKARGIDVTGLPDQATMIALFLR